MNSAFILDALRRHYHRAAFVPELVLTDEETLAVWEPNGDNTPYSRRIDALMFDGHQRTAIEIKVSLADFKRDTWLKRRPWARLVHRFVYVVPYGMDFPEGLRAQYSGCGLWWVDDAGRVTVKHKAKVQPYPEPLPNQIIAALAYRAAGVSRI